MSELSATNQIARLEYVIREQMKEIDRLRDEVRQHRALMAAFEERGTLGILQMMAHDKNITRYRSQTGQDKWVAETMFPGIANGFFLDVGSGDGYIHSNTQALEARGWKGICVDPFPQNMDGRTCQMFKDVVWNKSGETGDRPTSFRSPWQNGRVERLIGSIRREYDVKGGYFEEFG